MRAGEARQGQQQPDHHAWPVNPPLQPPRVLPCSPLPLACCQTGIGWPGRIFPIHCCRLEYGTLPASRPTIGRRASPFRRTLLSGGFESPRRVVGRPGALEVHPVGSRKRGLRRLQVAAHRLKGPEDLRGRIREESSNIVQLETLIVNRRTVMAS